MYDDFMKKRLDEKLLEFRYALDKNIFPRNPGDAECKLQILLFSRYMRMGFYSRK